MVSVIRNLKAVSVRPSRKVTKRELLDITETHDLPYMLSKIFVSYNH